MATPVMDVSVEGLRKVHFEQLSTNLRDYQRDEHYYGPKKQYMKRHQELVEWVDGIIRKFEKSV